jgi:hypothetical protein
MALDKSFVNWPAESPEIRQARQQRTPPSRVIMVKDLLTG